MLTGECTDYAWLSIVDFNLAYWRGSNPMKRSKAVFEITFQCPDDEVLERVDAGDHCTNGGCRAATAMVAQHGEGLPDPHGVQECTR